jgi:hypothetical protein
MGLVAQTVVHPPFVRMQQDLSMPSLEDAPDLSRQGEDALARWHKQLS